MVRQRIEQSIVIARTPDVVFDYVDTHREDAVWRTGFVAITQITPGPVGPGTDYHETVKTFGRRTEATVRVRDRQPGQFLTYDVRAGSSAFVVEYRFAPAARGTRLTRAIEADFGPIGFVARFVAALLRRSLANDLPALQRLIESAEPGRLAA